MEIVSAETWNSGLRYATKSGIRVRSKIEKIIADFLFEEGIRFIYEPRLRVGDLNFRPDFYLPDYDIFYEHFGRTDAGYRAAAEAKTAAYQKGGINFFYTTVEEELEIEDAIVDQLAVATLR